MVEFSEMLIDGDILVYSAAFASQKTVYQVTTGVGEDAVFTGIRDARAYAKSYALPEEAVEVITTADPWEHCQQVVDTILGAWHLATDCSKKTVYLSGEGVDNNFRFKVDPEYKQNRKDFVKPVHYHRVRQYLQGRYGAYVTVGMEADDALGIAQTDTTVIVSKDKDLLMIPGYHLRPLGSVGSVVMQVRDPGSLKLERDEAGKPRIKGTGIKFFCSQMLTGDSVDNIKGVPRMGPVKAFEALEKCETARELWGMVKKVYESSKLSEEYLLQQAQLLWILRQDKQYFSEDLIYDLGC